MRLVSLAAKKPLPEASCEKPENPSLLFSEVEVFLDRVGLLTHTTEAFPWSELARLLRRVIGSLEASRDLFWWAVAPASPPEASLLARHQARLAILSLCIGSNVASGDELLELGLSASLCDVGLWTAPGAANHDQRPRAPIEQAPDRDHPRRSADLIRRWSPPSEDIMQPVLQHHERENGHGYPEKLRGGSIHRHAKVIGLVDLYAGLTIAPSGLPRPDLYKAIHTIKQLQQEFPAAYIKALMDDVSLFPPGTVVRLSTGEVGQVVAVNRHYPMRPRVELLRTANGERLAEPRGIDLSTSAAVSIAGVEEPKPGSAWFDRRDGFWKHDAGYWR